MLVCNVKDKKQTTGGLAGEKENLRKLYSLVVEPRLLHESYESHNKEIFSRISPML
jgi:hypothetical protein